MRLKLDKKADALYLRLDDSRIVESEQVAPGVIVDFDGRNKVVGVEILDISERTPRQKLRKRTSSRQTTPALVREKPHQKYGR